MRTCRPPESWAFRTGRSKPSFRGAPQAGSDEAAVAYRLTNSLLIDHVVPNRLYRDAIATFASARSDSDPVPHRPVPADLLHPRLLFRYPCPSGPTQGNNPSRPPLTGSAKTCDSRRGLSECSNGRDECWWAGGALGARGVLPVPHTAGGYADPWLPFATVFAALVGATAGDWCRRCSAWSTSRNSRLGGPADGEIDENLGTTCPSECAGRCLSFA